MSASLLNCGKWGNMLKHAEIGLLSLGERYKIKDENAYLLHKLFANRKQEQETDILRFLGLENFY